MSVQLIAIHGAPRSGTSWLGQLFNSSEHVAYRYQPLFSHAFRGHLTPHSDTLEIQRFVKDLEQTTDDFVLQRGSSRLALTEPRFTKATTTHLVYKEVRFHQILSNLLLRAHTTRLIGIVRDPRAVLSSWINAPREFDPSWSIESEWRNAPRKNAGLEENWYGFERWRQLAKLFDSLMSLYPSRVRIVRYEELVADPLGVLGALFEFSGMELSAQSSDFVKASTSRNEDDPYGVYRSADNIDHANDSLPNSISMTITSELKGTALARFLNP